MADTSIWNIGGALLGGLLNSQPSQNTQTQQSQPWAPAQPWIQSNINSGQNLQAAYQAQPLSAGQLGSYANSFGLTNNFRNTAGSLINQMNTPTQFDRTNPLGRATPYNFSGSDTSGMGGGTGVTSNGDNLGMGGMYPQVAQPTSVGNGQAPQQSNPMGYTAPQGIGSNGKTIGNTSNFNDGQWGAIKQMNDAYGFFGNPVNQIGLGAIAGVAAPGLAGFTGLDTGSPMTAQQRSVDAINAFNAAPQYAMYNNPDAVSSNVTGLGSYQPSWQNLHGLGGVSGAGGGE